MPTQFAAIRKVLSHTIFTFRWLRKSAHANTGETMREVAGRDLAEIVDEVALHITRSAPSGATVVARKDA